jgi:hypothetical protein
LTLVKCNEIAMSNIVVVKATTVAIVKSN